MNKLCIIAFAKYLSPLTRIEFGKDGNAFDFDRNVLEIDVDELCGSDYGFMRHLKEVHDCSWADDISITIWTIAHEIGHKMTYEDLECEGEPLMRDLLNMVDSQKLASDPSVQDLYFNMESEWEATEWAREWIKNHYKLCKLITRMEKR